MTSSSTLSPLRELCYTFLKLPDGKQEEIVNQMGDWVKNNYNFCQDAKDLFFSLYDAAEENKKLVELWHATMIKANSEKVTPNPYL